MKAFMSDRTALPAALLAAGARPVNRYTIQSRAMAERQHLAEQLAEREARAILEETEPHSEGVAIGHTVPADWRRIAGPDLVGALGPFDALAEALTAFVADGVGE